MSKNEAPALQQHEFWGGAEAEGESDSPAGQGTQCGARSQGPEIMA